ncbi:hypothetical protein CC666_19295 [Salmonella enterica subsp. enterica serovar Panama]|nr:hypothetical protein [Salmonella enterica subsp. enterica serovar Panama]
MFRSRIAAAPLTPVTGIVPKSTSVRLFPLRSVTVHTGSRTVTVMVTGMSAALRLPLNNSIPAITPATC